MPQPANPHFVVMHVIQPLKYIHTHILHFIHYIIQHIHKQNHNCTHSDKTTEKHI